MNPEIRLYYGGMAITDYEVLRYLGGGFFTIKLNRPILMMGPGGVWEECEIFLTRSLNINDYREIKIKQILNENT